MIHPLTTAQKAAQATISPAAQLLLSGADRGMFIVGAGEEEVFTNKLSGSMDISVNVDPCNLTECLID